MLAGQISQIVTKELQTGERYKGKSQIKETRSIAGKLNPLLHTEKLDERDKQVALDLFAGL